MSTPSSSSNSLPLLRDFADWHSPMVVKELRHGLRTRFFILSVLLLHSLLAMLMTSALLGANQETVTGFFWGIAIILLLFVMPLRGFGALAVEAKGGAMDMLTLTSISSFRIVYGKWAALFGQTLLIASSLLPYMIARYFFGGVEVPRELAAMVVLVLASALSLAALVSFSAQGSLLFRLALAVGIMVASLPLGVMTMSSLLEDFGNPMMSGFLNLRGWEQAGLSIGALILTAYGVYSFLSLGSSRIAPVSENHSTAKRLAGLGVIMLLGIAGGCLALFHADHDAAEWVFYPAMFFALVLGADVTTESMPRFPTVVAPFMARGRFGGLLGRFLYPGWASGVVIYFLLCLSPLAIMICQSWRVRGDITFFTPALLLAANAVPVCIGWRHKNRFAHACVVHIAFFALAIAVHMLVEVTDNKAFGIIGLAGPISSLLARHDIWLSNEELPIWAGASSLLWCLGALALAIREMRVYRRLEVEVATAEAPFPSKPLSA